MDIEQIRQHYFKMDNARLEHIAKFEMANVQPEVRPIIMAEIQRRGMDKNLFSGIEAQTKQLTNADIEEALKGKGTKLPSMWASKYRVRGWYRQEGEELCTFYGLRRKANHCLFYLFDSRSKKPPCKELLIGLVGLSVGFALSDTTSYHQTFFGQWEIGANQRGSAVGLRCK
ncbi:MAG: hypothetical protein IPM82_28475 [Saprospiraceae bacterium]|nr:hypothetical protein [Saprospiraceae bacterium]